MFSRVGVVWVVLVLVACDGGAGSDGGTAVDGTVGGGPHATVAWTMRCAGATCPGSEAPARSVDHTDGQAGHEVACDLTSDGTTRTMDLTVRSPEGYGFEVRGARIGIDGGRLMGVSCQMFVFEPSDVDVAGGCSSNLPSTAQPCQITRVDIRNVEGVPTLLGQVLCEDVLEEGSPTNRRGVTSATSATGYADFTFTGCAGL